MHFIRTNTANVYVESDGRENKHLIQAAQKRCRLDHVREKKSPDCIVEIAARQRLYGRYTIVLDFIGMEQLAAGLEMHAGFFSTDIRSQRKIASHVLHMAARLREEATLCFETQLAGIAAGLGEMTTLAGLPESGQGLPEN